MTEAFPSMRFAQKNVLITGAAAGLGRQIGRAFAAEGADIAILDFQDASATVREITALKRRCEFFRSDVRDEDGVKTAVAGAAKFFGGRIDVLVNNAGFNAICPGPIEGDRIEDVMAHHAKIEGKSVADVRREWEATPMNRFVEPQEVAAVMLFLCSSDASAMTGQAINVTGGFIMT
jgi:NAD(P)-dependent dehydrogenase (short-subunit alcohol dehydrogenase family)